MSFMTLITRSEPRRQHLRAGAVERIVAGEAVTSEAVSSEAGASEAGRSEAGRSEAGYSLVELLISTVVLTLVLGGLMVVVTQTQGAEDVELAQADMRQQARVAGEQLASEIRMLGANIDNVPEALIAGQPSSITFAVDVDAGDAAPPCGSAFETATDGGAERIAYRMQGTQLLRTVDCWDGGAWNNEYTDQVVADDIVGAPLFRYFDEAGTEIVPAAGGLTATERADVRVIRIQLSMDDGEDHMLGDSRADFQMSTQVRLRNAGS